VTTGRSPAAVLRIQRFPLLAVADSAAGLTANPSGPLDAVTDFIRRRRTDDQIQGISSTGVKRVDEWQTPDIDVHRLVPECPLNVDSMLNRLRRTSAKGRTDAFAGWHRNAATCATHPRVGHGRELSATNESRSSRKAESSSINGCDRTNRWACPGALILTAETLTPAHDHT
jgi:hypothetical protein